VQNSLGCRCRTVGGRAARRCTKLQAGWLNCPGTRRDFRCPPKVGDSSTCCALRWSWCSDDPPRTLAVLAPNPSYGLARSRSAVSCLSIRFVRQVALRTADGWRKARTGGHWLNHSTDSSNARKWKSRHANRTPKCSSCARLNGKPPRTGLCAPSHYGSRHYAMESIHVNPCLPHRESWRVSEPRECRLSPELLATKLPSSAERRD
jgi:hypothetical protein